MKFVLVALMVFAFYEYVQGCISWVQYRHWRAAHRAAIAERQAVEADCDTWQKLRSEYQGSLKID